MRKTDDKSGPASGKNITLKLTDNTGPTMKQISSTTDSKENAVCNLWDPRYSLVQRARTIADIFGIQPAHKADRNSVQ